MEQRTNTNCNIFKIQIQKSPKVECKNGHAELLATSKSGQLELKFVSKIRVRISLLQFLLVMIGPKIEVGIERNFEATPLEILSS